jgi:hypothetical protein
MKISIFKFPPITTMPSLHDNIVTCKGSVAKIQQRWQQLILQATWEAMCS